MKFAILGPGRIAQKMAEAVCGLKDVELYAIGSTNAERAETFAKQWNATKWYGSYEEMLKDDAIDLVYVATPHSFHYEHAKMCLQHGKNVLVEKPFTVNGTQARDLIAYAKEKNLFLMEAMWSRCMPSRFIIEELLEKGTIGQLTSITANLGYSLQYKERMNEPSLAGGALLDLGIYPISFARTYVKKDVVNAISTAVMSPKGIDWTNSITLTFENGVMAVLHSNMLAQTDELGILYGTDGYIEVQDINNCREIRVFKEGKKTVIPIPEQINGYEYEVLDCMRAIEKGQIECENMPLSETLWVIDVMDALRKEWDMIYPFEK